MRSAKPEERMMDKRKLIAPAFLGVLYALSIQELVQPTRQATQAPGFEVAHLAFALVAFLTILRFFVGASLFLVDRHVARFGRTAWLLSFLVLVVQATGFVFLAGVANLALSAKSILGFPGLLHAILLLDVIWIVGLWLYRHRAPKVDSQPFTAPVGWALLNIAAVLIGHCLHLGLVGDERAYLFCFGALHLVVFLVDVAMVDHYMLLDPD